VAVAAQTPLDPHAAPWAPQVLGAVNDTLTVLSLADGIGELTAGARVAGELGADALGAADAGALTDASLGDAGAAGGGRRAAGV